MNALNRILSILLLVGLVASAAVTLGLVWDVLTLGAVRYAWPYPPVERVTYDVAHLSEGTIYWVVGGSIVCGILALVLLVREVLPPSRSARMLVLSGEGPGRTEMSYRGLDELAARSAQGVAGIERAHARVERRRGALAVRCRVQVPPHLDPVTVGPAVELTIADRLQQATGLPVHSVRVHARVHKERGRRMR